MKANVVKKRKGFTLVEVMLAVGVVAISITAMIGLLSSIRGSMNTTRHQNKAMSLIANVETTLQMASFPEVYRWMQDPASPYVIFYWDEYQNPKDKENSSLVTVSSEIIGTPQEPPNQKFLRNAKGSVYRVVLSLYQNALKGMRIEDSPVRYSGGSLPGSPELYMLNYIPIKVDIYAESRQNITRDEGSRDVNRQRLIYSDIVMKLR